MIIEVTNVMCRLAGATDAETTWVQGYLSFSDVKWAASEKRVTMLDLSGRFPGGLLPLLKAAAKRDGVVIEELDKRTSRLHVDDVADLDWLRPYQIEAVEACVQARRGICRAPTGSGKGEMIIGLTRALPGRWLFVVHRDTLVTQQAARYRKRTGLEPNIIQGGDSASWAISPGLNLITFQSLAAGIRNDPDATDRALARVDGLMIDECHVAPANVYYNAIQRCNAEYRIGFSGTPLDRTDNRSLMAIAALGTVIYSISSETLIKAGVLAMPRITMVKVTQVAPKTAGRPGFRARAASFKKAYDAMIVDSVERNAAIVELVKTAPKPCMVFVKVITHGKRLAKDLERAGMSSEFVWGNTKSETRLAAIERLERRDSDVMVASVVFQEGVDIPSLESVIIASGGKSVIATLQRIGRGMRTNDGKKSSFEVFDILDVGSPMLERHSRRRMNTYVRESYETLIRSEDGRRTTTYSPTLKTRRQKRERGL